MTATEITALPPAVDRNDRAAVTRVRNRAIHPVQGPTSAEEIGASGGFTASRPGNRLAIVAFAGIVLTALNLRSAVTAVPPLLGPIESAIGLGPTVVGLMGSLPTLAFSLAGLLGVRLLRSLAAEKIAVGVLAIEAIGQVVRPFTGGVAGFLAVTAATLLGMGIGNVILPPLVKAWFPTRIGIVTAAYVTALAVGTSVPALLAVPVAARIGWQPGLALWGLAALLPLPAWLVLARHARVKPPRAGGTGPAAGLPAESGVVGNEVGPAAEGSRLAVHKSPIAWGLALLFGMNALNLYAMFTWLPVRLTDAGLSETAAGAQLALFAGVGVVPSLLIPVLLGRIGRAGAMVAACIGFYLVGYLGLLLAPMTLTSLWAVLAGLGGGGFPLVLTLFGLRSSSPVATGALAGFAQGIGYLAAASGPLLVGLLHDLTGGWVAPFGFLALTLALMGLGGYLVCRTSHTVEVDLAARREGRAFTKLVP